MTGSCMSVLGGLYGSEINTQRVGGSDSVLQRDAFSNSRVLDTPVQAILLGDICYRPAILGFNEGK